MSSSVSKFEGVDASVDANAARPRGPRETPTHKSMEAVRLAEAETKLAHANRVETSQARRIDELESGTFASRDSAGYEIDLSGALAPAVEREDDPFELLEPVLASTEEDDPFAALSSVDEPDPFGGLVPVDDEERLPDRSVTSREGSCVAVAPMLRVLHALLGPKDIAALPIDPRSAFLLGQVDGHASVEEIIDICGMPQDEALELVDRLLGLGVIAFR